MPKRLLKSNVFLEMENEKCQMTNGKGPFFGSTKNRFVSIAPHVMLWSFPLNPLNILLAQRARLASETLL